MKHFEGFHNTCCLWIRPYALEGMKQKFQKTTQKETANYFVYSYFMAILACFSKSEKEVVLGSLKGCVDSNKTLLNIAKYTLHLLLQFYP